MPYLAVLELASSDFDESKVKRDDGGQFASKEGSSSSSEDSKSEDSKSEDSKSTESSSHIEARAKRFEELGFSKEYSDESRGDWNRGRAKPPPPIKRADRDFISEYTDDSADINAYMWETEFGKKIKNNNPEQSYGIEKRVSRIDSVIRDHGKPKEVVRHVPEHRADQTLARYERLLEEDKDSIEKGISSTTSCMNCFGDGADSSLTLRISAKRALNLSGMSSLPYEQEYLLESGTRLRPLKIEKSQGRAVVYLEQIVEDKPTKKRKRKPPRRPSSVDFHGDDAGAKLSFDDYPYAVLELADFDESKVKRDAGGKFSTKEGTKIDHAAHKAAIKAPGPKGHAVTAVYNALKNFAISIKPGGSKFLVEGVITGAYKDPKSKNMAVVQIKKPNGGLMTTTLGPAAANKLLNQHKKGLLKKEGKDEKTSEPTQKPSNIPSVSELKTVQSLGGSTGAKLMEDKGGNKFVVKKGNSLGHINNEAQANDIYRAAGISVPNSKMKGDAQVAEFIEGSSLANHMHDEKVLDKVREGFAVDAWTGNWDVVGLGKDNILVDKQGNVHRIDNGGSLEYRAQGAKKGISWNSNVTELDTMRNKKYSAGQVFGKLTDEQVATQINDLVTSGKAKKILNSIKSTKTRVMMEERLKSMQSWANTKLAKPEPEPNKETETAKPKFVPSGHKIVDHFAKNIGREIDVTKKGSGKKVKGTILAVKKTPKGSKTSAVLTIKQPDGSVKDFILGQAAASQAQISGKSTKETGIASVGAFDTYKTNRKARLKELGLKEHKFNESYGQWQSKAIKPPPPISPAQVTALKSYVGSGALKMNTSLWGGGKETSRMKALSKLIENHGKPQKVIRNVPNSFGQKTLARYEKMLESGEDGIELGYSSSSGTTKSLGSDRPVKMVIAAKKALNVSDDHLGKDLPNQGEREYILDKGSRFRVLDIEYHGMTYGGHKKATIYLEQVG